MSNVTGDSLATDNIPLDVEACIERWVTFIRLADPGMLEQEEGRDRAMKEIEAFREEARQAVTPYAKPTRVACKR